MTTQLDFFQNLTSEKQSQKRLVGFGWLTRNPLE